MSNEKNKTTAAAPALIEEKALTNVPKETGTEISLSPIFVEAEKMFERFAELTRLTAHKAYEFFQKRGGEFGKELDDWFKAESEVLRPVPVEITETDGKIKVSASVPGYKPEEIEISVKGNNLILSGTTEDKMKKEDEKMIYTEWRSNHFFRSIPLPGEVMADKVKANLKDGILHLTLPKLPEHEPTSIKITE